MTEKAKKFFGFVVKAVDQKKDGGAVVSPRPYQTRSAAEVFMLLYKKEHPDKELFITEDIK